MGGSGGGSYRSRDITVDDLITGANRAIDGQAYDAEVNDLLGQALQGFNDRDTVRDRERLDEVLEAVRNDGDDTVDLRFGGSVRKHTYVDGLSDVDVLAVIGRGDLAGKPPPKILGELATRLRSRIAGAEVTVGTLAVTVRYPDGRELQVLPALSTATGVRITGADGQRWSNVVRPDSFAQKLTAVNRANGGRVVPVIKLFKATLETLRPPIDVSGYHAESLAIAAFEKYDGPRTYKAMLHHLCRTSIDRVGTPIKDRTGQSLHVDDYLGAPGSHPRRELSARLGRLLKRIEAADRSANVGAWAELLGEED